MIEGCYNNRIRVKTEGNQQLALLLTHLLLLGYDPDSEGQFEGEMLTVEEEHDRQQMLEQAGYGEDALSGEERTVGREAIDLQDPTLQVYNIDE